MSKYIVSYFDKNRRGFFLLESDERPKLGLYQSVGGPYDEGKLKAEIHTVPCSKCRGLITLSFSKECIATLVERELCFCCNHWFDRTTLFKKNPEIYIQVAGKAYSIHSKKGEESRYCGFGGHMFHIQRADGRLSTCSNVWHQGDIPARWRDGLPDTATFITKEEYEHLSLQEVKAP